MKKVHKLLNIKNLLFILFIVLISYSCGGDDGTPNCSPLWNIRIFGTADIESNEEEGLVLLEVDKGSIELRQDVASLSGDFTLRLSFINFQGSSGSLYISMDSRDIETGSGTFIGGASVGGNTGGLNLLAVAGFGSDLEIMRKAISSTTNSGTITISRKGNVLTSTVSVDFETVTAVYEYAYSPDISFVIALENESENHVEVQLTNFSINGNGASSDNFECDRLIR